MQIPCHFERCLTVATSGLAMPSRRYSTRCGDRGHGAVPFVLVGGGVTRVNAPCGRGLWWEADGASETGGNRLDDLNGKVAVVTGGAAGIGRGITEALLEEGARVVIADVEEPVLEVAVKELADAGAVRGRA